MEGTEDFTRRLRVLRNLLAASGPDEIRSQNMPGLLRDVEAIIVRRPRAGERLSRNQVVTSRRRRTSSTHPDLAALHRLEDHPLLRGTLTVFELDQIASRAGDAFEAAFDPANYLDLTGALLATGDYQRRRPTQSWQFGTADPQTSVWRYLLTRPRARTSPPPAMCSASSSTAWRAARSAR